MAERWLFGCAVLSESGQPRGGDCPSGAAYCPGGHHIPEDVIRRRFAAGLQNFETLYRKEVDFWRRYNNSGDVLEILDEGTNP